jgi:hypothetical protein
MTPLIFCNRSAAWLTMTPPGLCPTSSTGRVGPTHSTRATSSVITHGRRLTPALMVRVAIRARSGAPRNRNTTKILARIHDHFSH